MAEAAQVSQIRPKAIFLQDDEAGLVFSTKSHLSYGSFLEYLEFAGVNSFQVHTETPQTSPCTLQPSLGFPHQASTYIQDEIERVVGHLVQAPPSEQELIRSLGKRNFVFRNFIGLR